MANPDPVEAGRKGGQSRSAAKLAAARRNGFQKRRAPHCIEERCLPRPAEQISTPPKEDQQ
jgi:hypothetical protein